jgi:acyl-[acyl-carrier-protein]-phospholipid O-acyltransferase / long-chain-fatty-acid--[acyl-carrier-protein] ligase
VVLIALAGFGFLTSFGISKVPAADPAKKFRANFLADLWAQIKLIRKDRVLWLATVGNTYFFALAALIQFLIVIYAKDVLNHFRSAKEQLSPGRHAIGIGLGSFAAGYLSGGKIEYGLIPLGSIGMTVLAALLGRRGLSFADTWRWICRCWASSADFSSCPLRPCSSIGRTRKARAACWRRPICFRLSAFSRPLASITLVTVVLHLESVHRFPAHRRGDAGRNDLRRVAAARRAAPVWSLAAHPHALPRARARPREYSRKGGALFVCNHVSFVDALLLIASTDRRVRFMMFAGIYELPYVKPFARILGVIPISSAQRPRDMLKSLQTASEAIRAGDVVCIFAEGQITRIGQLLPFRRGMEQIMKDVEAPIVPVALDGVWGSIFSFEKRRFVWKWPRRIPYPVTVSFGPPMPPRATASEVRQAVQELLASAWHLSPRQMRPCSAPLCARRGGIRSALPWPTRNRRK